MTEPLIVGIGNPMRGDDGCGPVAVEHLSKRLPGCRFYTVSENTLSVLDRWDKSTTVYLIDAALCDREPGTVNRYDLLSDLKAIPPSVVSGHSFSVIDLIELAKTLSLLPARCILYTVEGENFSVGDPISEPVRKGIDQVVLAISREVESPDQIDGDKEKLIPPLGNGIG